MNTQIEQLKTELREFLELSKTITPKWEASDNVIISEATEGYYLAIFDGPKTNTAQDPKNALFAARSRNISPSLAECLLMAVENLELIHEQTDLGEYAAWDALQQILTIWEAAK